MTQPIVSISCIAYNQVSYIRQCLDGFLMQDCDFAFEVLIHDDASTDGTQDIIKEYQEKYPDIIKPIFQQENQYSKGTRGMNILYNFPRAVGKYIALCEGDDYWTDPFKLKKQVDFLEENPDYVLIGHDRLMIDNNSNIIINKCRRDYYTQCLVFKNVLKKDYLQSNNLKITNGDTFLILYLRNFGKQKLLDFVGAAYRVTASGSWSKKTKNQKYLLAEESYVNMKCFFKKYNYLSSVLTVERYLIDNDLTYLVNQNRNICRVSCKIIFNSIRFRYFNGFKSLIYVIYTLKFKKNA